MYCKSWELRRKKGKKKKKGDITRRFLLWSADTVRQTTYGECEETIPSLSTVVETGVSRKDEQGLHNKPLLSCFASRVGLCILGKTWTGTNNENGNLKTFQNLFNG